MFYQTDSEELFIHNKKILGPEWIWWDRPITYKFNSQSFRMDKQIEEVNFDNYGIFFGCSNTMGHGVRIEDTFAYKTAITLNLDYINAGVGGASPSYVADNLSKFLDRVDRTPKFVVINWPNLFRKYYVDDSGMEFKIPEKNEKDQWYEEYKNFLMNDELIVNEFKEYRQRCVNMCQKKNTPYYDFTLANFAYEKYVDQISDLKIRSGYYNIKIEKIEIINEIKARDISDGRISRMSMNVSHPGIGIHNSISKEIVDWYSQR
jgi:hypothetical protein